MSKGRGPRKPKVSTPKSPPIDEQPIGGQTQEKTELPAPRPPTVVRAETPPSSPREQQRLALVEFLETCRAAVLSLLDLADAAAEAITRRTGPGSA
jgi:hypothetical protein